VLGLLGFWKHQEIPKKAKWKEMVGEAVYDWEKANWTEWKQGMAMKSDWGVGMISVWGGRESKHMMGKEGQILAAIRLMATREEVGDRAGTGETCLVCGATNEQGIIHLVTMCMEWKGERRSALGPGVSSWSRRKRWACLTNGKVVTVHFLKEMVSGYEDITGSKLIPWVGALGTRVEAGVSGMTMLVQNVAEWVGREEGGS